MWETICDVLHIPVARKFGSKFLQCPHSSISGTLVWSTSPPQWKFGLILALWVWVCLEYPLPLYVGTTDCIPRQIPIATANYRNGIGIGSGIVADLGFLRLGAPTTKRGANLLFGRIFAENCMKMKKMEQGEEGTSLEALLRSANADQLNVNKPLRRETN